MSFLVAQIVMTDFEWQAVGLSLLVACTAVLVSLPLGIVFGWLLARKQFWGKPLLEAFLNLPLVLPPVVTGYLLLILFGSNGLLGRYLTDWFGLRFVFDWKGAALAAAVVSFPLMVRAIKVSFKEQDTKLESAASVLGASPLDTFFSISLPLAKNGLIAGSLLAFARSLGEFGATIMIAGNIQGETQTIPLYVFNQLQAPGGATEVFRIVVVSVLISAAALFAADWIERRGDSSPAGITEGERS